MEIELPGQRHQAHSKGSKRGRPVCRFGRAGPISGLCGRRHQRHQGHVSSLTAVLRPARRPGRERKTIRRIQIREAIKAHLEKEKRLFPQGIKVLTLFFIDEVAKYRDYSQADEKGEYARSSRRSTSSSIAENLTTDVVNLDYRKYLKGFRPPGRTTVTFQSTRRPSGSSTRFKTRGEEAGCQTMWMPMT